CARPPEFCRGLYCLW
nr:immunoglobulin heavy chain junction region [Macaca mulatta]MOV49537.1 immunoglobulin heavy chain junction region [Macaca mulatta]MOV49614.1 immunoglobulin heavy chain junction region [Macaca mulatta]MOV49900.1 immunoglobulin heavy chain junction region [Macaca mulatta]MOV50453.1 immunoglobulin heavy chain junction region [Macaca mulatta]